MPRVRVITRRQRHQVLRDDMSRLRKRLGDLDGALSIICPVGHSGHPTEARAILRDTAHMLDRLEAELVRS